MNEGFLASLFDYSFSSLITPKIIRGVYVLVTVLAALGAFAVFAGLAGAGGGGAVLGLVVAPLLFLFYLVLARIYLEIVIVVFRMGEDVRRLADRQSPPLV
jgi:hypothetical protein